MSGFSSAILTSLLSWMRSLIANLWLLLGSAEGDSFFSFLRAHWLTLFVALCVGFFILDRLIYLVRWRPDYVWATRLERFKRRLRGEKKQEDPQPRLKTRPRPKESLFADSLPFQRPDAPTVPPLPLADEPPSSAEVFSHAQPVQRMDFAPQAQQTVSYSYVPEDFDLPVKPVFDEAASWMPQEVVRSPRHSPLYGHEPFLPVESYAEPFENPGENLPASFGRARPEPAQYLHDVAAGFAPPPTPEALYSPRPATADEPVHPGLDAETFQQNIGLSPASKPPESGDAEPEGSAEGLPSPAFPAFYQADAQEDSKRSRNLLSGFAKRARNLMSLHDEEHPPTIRDLQSTVDIKRAFHAPVFPHSSEKGGEEEE